MFPGVSVVRFYISVRGSVGWVLGGVALEASIEHMLLVYAFCLYCRMASVCHSCSFVASSLTNMRPPLCAFVADAFVNSQEWTLSRAVPDLKVVSAASRSSPDHHD